jgi:hypothetical protein
MDRRSTQNQRYAVTGQTYLLTLSSALSWVVTQRAEALSAGAFTAVGSSFQMIWFVHLVWTVSYLALCCVLLCRLTLGPFFTMPGFTAMGKSE